MIKFFGNKKSEKQTLRDKLDEITRPIHTRIAEIEAKEREERIRIYFPLLAKKYNVWCDNTGYLCPNIGAGRPGYPDEKCTLVKLEPIERAIKCSQWCVCVGSITGSHTTVYGDVLPEDEMEIPVPELLPLIPTKSWRKHYKEGIAKARKSGFYV